MSQLLFSASTPSPASLLLVLSPRRSLTDTGGRGKTWSWKKADGLGENNQCFHSRERRIINNYFPGLLFPYIPWSRVNDQSLPNKGQQIDITITEDSEMYEISPPVTCHVKSPKHKLPQTLGTQRTAAWRPGARNGCLARSDHTPALQTSAGASGYPLQSVWPWTPHMFLLLL